MAPCQLLQLVPSGKSEFGSQDAHARAIAPNWTMETSCVAGIIDPHAYAPRPVAPTPRVLETAPKIDVSKILTLAP